MKYVLLDCDYTEREDYRLNKEVSKEEIVSKEDTTNFVHKIEKALNRFDGYEHVVEIVFEPFIEKKDALELIREDSISDNISLLNNIVYATCLVEGDSSVVDRGLEVIASDVIILDAFYAELESNGYTLSRVTTEDLKNDIVNGSMLKRENLLTGGRKK